MSPQTVNEAPTALPPLWGDGDRVAPFVQATGPELGLVAPGIAGDRLDVRRTYEEGTRCSAAAPRA